MSERLKCALEWQAFHMRRVKEVAATLSHDMELSPNPDESDVTLWRATISWLALYAGKLADVADKDASSPMMKGGAK